MEDPAMSPRNDPEGSRPHEQAPSAPAHAPSWYDPAAIEARMAAYRVEVPCDEQGPIPTKFPRAQFDEAGHLIPPSPEEMKARQDAYWRLKKFQSRQPIEEEPPGLDEEIMRGIDSHRPEGSKLFEGYY